MLLPLSTYLKDKVHTLLSWIFNSLIHDTFQFKMALLCYKTHHRGTPASATTVPSFIFSRHFLGYFCCQCLPYSSGFVLVSLCSDSFQTEVENSSSLPGSCLLISPSLTYNLAVMILFNSRPFRGCNWYERFCIS